MKAKLPFIFLVILCLTATSVMADVISFREDPVSTGYQTNVQDIRSGYTSNRGGVNRTIVGLDTPTMIYRGLYGFDISEIPAGATIDSISLTLTAIGGAGVSTSGSQVPAWNTGNFTDAVFSLQQLVGTMVENGPTLGSSGTSTDGGPTWLQRDIAAPAVDWTTAGGDFVTDPLASLTVNLTDILAEEAANDLPIPLTWSGTGASNNFVTAAQTALDGNGILNMLLHCPTSEAAGTEGCLLFFSDDPTTLVYSETYYPTLTVTFHEVPEPSTLVLLGSLFVGLLIWRRK